MSSAIISSADASRIPIPAENEDIAVLRDSVVAKLTYVVGRDPIVATDRDWFIATALVVRHHVIEPWRAWARANYTLECTRVYDLHSNC
jgi:starch phosphorylase